MNPTPTNHTAEPWSVSTRFHQGEAREYFIWGPLHQIAEITAKLDRGEELSNAKRIVACVNALAGLNPEALPDAVKALESAPIMLLGETHAEFVGKYAEWFRTNRNTALANLKGAQ